MSLVFYFLCNKDAPQKNSIFLVIHCRDCAILNSTLLDHEQTCTITILGELNEILKFKIEMESWEIKRSPYCSRGYNMKDQICQLSIEE